MTDKLTSFRDIALKLADNVDKKGGLSASEFFELIYPGLYFGSWRKVFCGDDIACDECPLHDYWRDFDLCRDDYVPCYGRQTPYYKLQQKDIDGNQFRDCCLSLAAACDQRIKELTDGQQNKD